MNRLPCRTIPWILIGGALLVGCAPPDSTSLRLIDAVPASAAAAVQHQLQKVRGDPDLSSFGSSKELDAVLEHLELEATEVIHLVVYLESLTNAGPVLAILLAGSFDTNEIRGHLLASGWEAESAGQGELLVDRDEDVWLAALSTTSLAAGHRAAVEAALAVMDGHRPGLTTQSPYDRIVARYMDEDRPIFALFPVGQEAQDMTTAVLEASSVVLDLYGLGSIGRILTKVGPFRGLGFAISRRGDKFPVHMDVIINSSAGAALISGSLNLLIKLASIASVEQMAPADRALYEDFQSMSITRDEEVLLISMSLSRSQVFGTPGGLP